MNTWQQEYEQALGINAQRDPSWSWEMIAPKPDEEKPELRLGWLLPLWVVAGALLWGGLGWLIGWLARIVL